MSLFKDIFKGAVDGFTGSGGSTKGLMGGITKVTSKLGIWGTAANMVIGIFGKLFKGGAKRNARLVQGSMTNAKNMSNLESGTIESINEYIRLMYRVYTYQVKVKGRKEGNSILDSVKEFEGELAQNGYELIDRKSYTQSRKKGDYNVDYNVWKEPTFASVDSQTTTETVQQVIQNPDGTQSVINVPLKKKDNTMLYIGGGLLGLLMLFKMKIIKI